MSPETSTVHATDEFEHVAEFRAALRRAADAFSNLAAERDHLSAPLEATIGPR